MSAIGTAARADHLFAATPRAGAASIAQYQYRPESYGFCTSSGRAPPRQPTDHEPQTDTESRDDNSRSYPLLGGGCGSLPRLPAEREEGKKREGGRGHDNERQQVPVAGHQSENEEQDAGDAEHQACSRDTAAARALAGA